MDVEDSILVSRARTEPDAFTALYDRYFAIVFRYCRSQLRDVAKAEDAASQTFVKALAALPSYRESGRFRSWLFTIAYNAIRDQHRGERAHTSLETVMELPGATPAPDDQVIAKLDLDWLEAAMERLPAQDREILELRRAGLSGREIAHVLGITYDAAKKRQLRAMDRLRSMLAVQSQQSEVHHGS